MGSIVEGAMAAMGIVAGLMVVFMSLIASEPVAQNSEVHAKDEGSRKSPKKAA